MPTDLSNRWIRWSFEPKTGRWSYSPVIAGGPGLRNASMGLSWTSGLVNRVWPSLLRGVDPEPMPGDQVLGQAAQGVRFQCQPDERRLQVQVDFAMLRDRPLLLTRMKVHLAGKKPVRLGRLGFVSAGLAHPGGARHDWEPRKSESADSSLSISADRQPARFFTNGWQSWSYSGSLSAADRQPRTRLGLLSSPIFSNPTTGQPTGDGHFVADMFGVVIDPAERSGLLAGFVTQQQAFGSLEVCFGLPNPGLRLWASGDGYLLKPGEAFETDWAALGWLSLDDVEPLNAYLDLAADAAHARIPEVPPTGWSSWYYFFESIDRMAFDQNLDWLEQNREDLPLDLVQLDDGFQANVGDWFRFNDRFKDGVKPVSRRTAAAGMQAGLWLAPYIAKPRSKWVRDHPEWVLRRAGGRPSNAGYNWSTFTVGLDPTHPGVETAVSELIGTAVTEWGFRFLKLDFLYAAALPGRRHDPSTTRAQAMHKALTIVRQAAGEQTWLLGCGCPLGTGIGIFDSMRIGPDVAPRWKPAFQGIEVFFKREPSLPSARNGLRAAISRSMLNRKWWLNDPDCLILRDQDTHLSRNEVQTMASVIALTAGALIDSDDLPSLSEERAAWLARLLPPLPVQARVHAPFEQSSPCLLTLDLSGPVGDWKLICLINWDDGVRHMDLDPGAISLDPKASWSGVDFWREELIAPGRGPWSFDVPPHGVRLISLRANPDSTPAWLGDTLHISQGLVVAEWGTAEAALRAGLAPGHRAHGRIWLALPGRPINATLDGAAVEFQPSGQGVFAADLAVDSKAELEVRWT